MNQEVKKYKVGQKAFKTQNLFSISAFIETKASTSSKYPYCEDIIFLEFSEGKNSSTGKFKYDTDNKISMMINSDELRCLMYACKELLKNGKSDYKNYSDPGLSSSTTNGSKKVLTLGLSQNTYFINIEMGNRKVSINFDKYKLLSFCDTLENIANEAESLLFNYQRKLEASINKQSQQQS